MYRSEGFAALPETCIVFSTQFHDTVNNPVEAARFEGVLETFVVLGSMINNGLEAVRIVDTSPATSVFREVVSDFAKTSDVIELEFEDSDSPRAVQRTQLIASGIDASKRVVYIEDYKHDHLRHTRSTSGVLSNEANLLIINRTPESFGTYPIGQSHEELDAINEINADLQLNKGGLHLPFIDFMYGPFEVDRLAGEDYAYRMPERFPDLLRKQDDGYDISWQLHNGFPLVLALDRSSSLTVAASTPNFDFCYPEIQRRVEENDPEFQARRVQQRADMIDFYFNRVKPPMLPIAV